MKSWNEIRKAATAFSKRWKNAYDEKSQAQSFLKEFFAVFGVDSVTVATFEHRVKFADGSQGYIDCFWLGTILVEMKSRGKDLDAAYRQAMDYVRSLPDASQMPRAIVVSDFARVRFYDLSRDCALTEFSLKDLRKYVTLFGYMIGAEDSGGIREQDPVNRRAAEQMARLHDAMKAVGYAGHPLEVYLVRLLFCLFAEDTSIFKPNQFCGFIERGTSADGHDLAPQLALLFQTLNTDRRLANLDESLVDFPYVNGGLFAETLPIAAFSPEMRRALLDCGTLDWSKISPAIFGAMFQGVMDEKARHDLGAHYTSEENILKLIRPLFLDALRAEFAAVCAVRGTSRKARLEAFHAKIAALTFLDPACGCGNFLLIAYRELRRLEMDVLEELHRDSPEQFLDVSQLCKVSVSQFHGIEIEPFAAEIAKVALWLMDHLCNMEVADRFGQYFARIPIKDTPHIVCANALTTDWHNLSQHFDYIFGNPPFLGVKTGAMSAEQKADMAAIFPKNRNLDFVCGWYKKAHDFILGTSTRCAFVSTNSITQGEQVTPLWKNLPNVKIDFGYRTFKWHNEARDNAAVHCVIIGFSTHETKGSGKTIYDGTKTIIARNINGYLQDAPCVLLEDRHEPICEDVPPPSVGSFPVDGGNFVIRAEEKAAFVANEPKAEKLLRLYIGPDEFIKRRDRYCLWLRDVPPSDLRTMPSVMQRVAGVREYRLASRKEQTRKRAATPTRFAEDRQPDSDYILIPRTSSERRAYLPIGFISADVIAGDTIIIPKATKYHFGVLTSRMHMAWMRIVCGRMKSDYRYSATLAYNNFCWPNVTEEQKSKIEIAAQAVLDARAQFPSQSLADLYDPLTMPPDLVKAHAHLDALVDKAYGLAPSCTDADRVAHLFKLYAAKTTR